MKAINKSHLRKLVQEYVLKQQKNGKLLQEYDPKYDPLAKFKTVDMPDDNYNYTSPMKNLQNTFGDDKSVDLGIGDEVGYIDKENGKEYTGTIVGFLGGTVKVKTFNNEIHYAPILWIQEYLTSNAHKFMRQAA